jgi:hypothetical protein
MLLFVVLVIALVFWYFGYWPLDRSYGFLPSFRDLQDRKGARAPVAASPMGTSAAAAPPDRITDTRTPAIDPRTPTIDRPAPAIEPGPEA